MFFKVGLISALVFLAMASNGRASGLSVSVQLSGNPSVVFDTKHSSCETIDIPDSDSRAFRDYQGNVHLFSSHYVARAGIGQSLDNLAHSCQIVYSSKKDGNPADFDDLNWLNAFWTDDGRKVVALVHSEYHGDAFKGMCTQVSDPAKPGHCWWNSITIALSNDGGYHFFSLFPPENFLVSAQQKYDPNNSQGATGYFQPSNIVKLDRGYYALVNAWNSQGQKAGACLFTTNSPFQPGAWLAWNGQNFSVKFVDPYKNVGNLAPATCRPVYPGTAESLVYDIADKVFIVSEFANDHRYGEPGLYLSLSKDLIHWGRPSLALSRTELEHLNPPGNWHFGYFSIIDSTSSDRSFSTTSDRPYIYYVRTDRNHGPYQRVLFREKIILKIQSN